MHQNTWGLWLGVAWLVLVVGCGSNAGGVAAGAGDSGNDAGQLSEIEGDAGAVDAADAAAPDGTAPDTAVADSGATDADSLDAGPADAGAADVAPDTGTADAVAVDATVGDTGTTKSCNPMAMGPAALCPAGQYCASPAGQCGAIGVCANKPEACTLEYAPVCGCDGKTYGNACGAAGAGVSIAKTGACTIAPELHLFQTCGYPVCPADWQPTDSVALCSSEKAGDPCSVEGQKCDAKAGCGQFLICAKSDPKAQGCPISKAKYKSDVHYVDASERRRMAAELLDTRLATYRYTAAGPGGPRHLGFIIEDQPDSPAVDAQRDMVDLYGYLSLSVATLQEQQRQIEQLRAELQLVRAQCGVGLPLRR